MDNGFPDRLYNWGTSSGLRIVAIVVAAVAFYFITRTLFRRLLKVARRVGEGDLVTREQEMRARTLAGIIRGLLIAVIFVIVSLMVLHELGYDVGPLLAGAGIAGLAVGLGAQTLVKDMIGGFFILLEGQFNVGDVVEVGGVTGKVEAIKLRTTQVRDDEGVLHVVPNGEMRVVSNLTKDWSKVNLDFDVDIQEDVDKVIDIIKDASRRAAQDGSPVGVYILEGPDVLGVESLKGKTVSIRVVARTEPFRDAAVAREIRRLVAKSLAENKVNAGDYTGSQA